jgi:glycine cleavage system transcriptional repressor
MTGIDGSENVLVSIFCRDRVGMIAAITSRLFDIGINLGDTTFAVLGEGAEFTAICELPEEVSIQNVETELRSLAELAGGEITVTPFQLGSVHGSSGRVTHRIEFTGSDQPGLIESLSDVFQSVGANIVRMNGEHVPAPYGGEFVLRFAVSIPEERVSSCLTAVDNKAGILGVKCRWWDAI